MLLAVPARADVYDRLAKKLVKNVEGLSKQKAAVLPFAYPDGRVSPGGAIVAEALATAIAQYAGAVLVERAQLEKSLKEIQLSYSGAVSSETVSHAGKLLGAKFLVIGSLLDDGPGSVQLHARLLETETGLVRSAAKAKIKKTWSDEPPISSLSDGLRVSTGALPAEQSGVLVKPFGDHRIAIEFSNTGEGPVIRFTDITDPSDREVGEAPLPYDPETNRFDDMQPARVHVGKRAYKVWLGAFDEKKWPIFHVAPFTSKWGEEVDGGQETLVEFSDLLRRWAQDVQDHGRFLGESEGLKLVASFEKSGSDGLRVAIWKIEGANNQLHPNPLARLSVKGKRGQTVSSSIVAAGPRHFRVRYDLDAKSVQVEEIP